MTTLHSDFFKTDDGESLKYQTNFSTIPPGNGPVLLFNYGLVCSELHWTHQINYFKDKYSIIVHDYRGHYESSGKDKLENLTISRIAKDTSQLLNHLKIDKVIAIGHSMGVNISLEMAISFPQNISGLALISGSIFSAKEVMLDSNIMDIITPFLDKFYEKSPKLFDLIWKSSQYNPIMKNIVHRGGFNVDTVPKDFVESYLKKLGRLGPGIFLQLFNSMSDHSLTMNIEDITSPSIVISGVNDKVIPHYTQSYIVDKIKDCEFYFLKNGSHVPQVDFPELVNERIEIFIQDIQTKV